METYGLISDMNQTFLLLDTFGVRKCEMFCNYILCGKLIQKITDLPFELKWK